MKTLARLKYRVIWPEMRLSPRLSASRIALGVGNEAKLHRPFD